MGIRRPDGSGMIEEQCTLEQKFSEGLVWLGGVVMAL